MDDRIDDRRVEMRTIGATVADVQTWSETSVGSSGGGVFVHPKYGAWVDPVRTWSSTEVVVRARLRYDDGRASSLDFPGSRVRLSVGDDILLVIAEEEIGKRWELAGVANATTGEFSYLGQFERICPMSPRTRTERFGRSGFILLFVWMFVMLAISGQINDIATWRSVFNTTFFGGFCILFVTLQARKAFRRRRAEAEQQYQSFFQRTCSTALTACQSATWEGRQAAPVVA